MKHLLDRLLMLQEEDKFTSVAVLSELNDEGKTFVTAALALAYTDRLKKRVLVVDTSTPPPAKAGESAPAGQVGQLHELLDKVDTVDVITFREWSGLAKGQDADEYQLKILLSQVGYGLILVDTCALMRRNRNNLDPAVIGRQCDAAVLVSAGTEVSDEISDENRKRLITSGVNLVGMIHNQRGIAP
jgi:Mrp family chromosome partitioning ATPase